MEIEADAPKDAAAGELDRLAQHAADPELASRAQLLVYTAYVGKPPRFSQPASAAAASAAASASAAPASARPVRLPFPGPNPISMDPEFIDVVRAKPYVCSPKVDGTRLQLVCVGAGEAAATAPPLLVDRRMRVFACTYARLPASAFLGGGTVLDAEMVGPTLYIFDAVLLCGDPGVARRPYTDRIAAVRAWLGGIASPEVAVGAMLLSLRLKPIFDVSLSRRLLLDPASLGFAERCDGIVLTPVLDPVRTFTAWTTYKVKPVHTLDFRLVMLPNRQIRAFTNPILSIPEGIAQRMKGPILKASLQPAPSADATPAGSGSLLRFSGASETSRKRARQAPCREAAQKGGTKQLGANIPVHTLRAPPAAEEGKVEEGKGRKEPAPAAPPAAPPAAQWILRLEYSHGTDAKDATRDGIEYNGRRVLLRIVENAALTEVLDKVEETWRGMHGDVIAMSLVAEFKVLLTPAMLQGPEEEVFCDAVLEKPRPDKHEPNNFLTMTRTLTTILHGVTERHLAVLERS